MEPGIDIHRRADGSIDIEHYLRDARAYRAAALKQCAWSVVALPGRLLRWIARLGTNLRDALRAGITADRKR